MATKDLMAPTIGVLDVDGLHLPAGSLAPVTEAIRHVGDLYNGARRHGVNSIVGFSIFLVGKAAGVRPSTQGGKSRLHA